MLYLNQTILLIPKTKRKQSPPSDPINSKAGEKESNMQDCKYVNDIFYISQISNLPAKKKVKDE